MLNRALFQETSFNDNLDNSGKHSSQLSYKELSMTMTTAKFKEYVVYRMLISNNE
jgi:hypothetical protein